MTDDRHSRPGRSGGTIAGGEKRPPSAVVASRAATAAADRRLFTVPNGLCVLRLLGALALPWLAVAGMRAAILWTFVGMAVTDWADGKLAILLDQRSDIGPRLDSIADVAMYVSLGVAALILDGPRLLAEWPWWGAALLSYLAAGLYGLHRHGRWPSHHTRIAKSSWLLGSLGGVLFVGGWATWPLRLALGVVALGNLESMAITRVLPEWRADVSSLSAACRLRDRRHGDPPAERPSRSSVPH